MDIKQLQSLCKLIRYNILTSTTAANAGHPSSSLSATELMTTLFFGGYFHYDLDNPKYIFNDRVIFSKGHASPLLYSLYQAAGVISEKELLTLRQFDSVLEGHPTPRFKYIDVATGSLGQGLSAGLGMALAIKKKWENGSKKLDGVENEKTVPNSHINNPASQFLSPTSRVWVLLGDSEMAEGQVWEALELGGYYKVNNLVGILDVNRLGQRGETMLEWDLNTYRDRIKAFGWNVILVENGNDLEQVNNAFINVTTGLINSDKPTMIIAKTKKGAGVSLLENLDNWHGKPLPKDKLEEALKELGPIDKNIKGKIQTPVQADRISQFPVVTGRDLSLPQYTPTGMVATREAYGDGLVALGKIYPNVVVLDGETSNSTMSEKFKKVFPDRFYEMYITEQNMVSTAVGMSKIGLVPFASSFAAFFTRAFDQIRMAQYSEANIKITGSHAGVSIGSDGSSQMALEDIAMMRSILNSVIFYPSDAISAYKLVEQMAKINGIVYMRTTREKTPILYSPNEEFPVGGLKILKQSDKDIAVIITAGITLHEALKAYEELKKQNINVCIVDLYCIKPLDEKTVNELAQKTKHIIVVEDHYPAGGIGEAILNALARRSLDEGGSNIQFNHLSVTKIPRSGKPEELLHYEKIDADAIMKAVTSSQ